LNIAANANSQKTFTAINGRCYVDRSE